MDFKTGIWIIILLICIIVNGCKCKKNNFINNIQVEQQAIKKPAHLFNPEKYICYKTGGLKIDGLIDEDEWVNAEWTSNFTDIEGDLRNDPLHQTRVKMLWDNQYLYIAAAIEEPHIWAKLRQRDTVIFYDNDFEVFIDPDGDTHGYYEFEMNALNTVWDLLLIKPYRDGGGVINSWDIKGIKSAVKIYGTLNDPSDIDEKWVIELAFPFDVLKEWGNRPSDGAQWRINFSRVNWRTEIKNNSYIKEINRETGRNYPEYNWVWSPQGVINMHYPEMWGFIQFSDTLSGQGKVDFIRDPDEMIKWNLRTLYYAQREFASKNNMYSNNPDELRLLGYEAFKRDPYIIITPSGYSASIDSPGSGLIWIIDNTGRISSVTNN